MPTPTIRPTLRPTIRPTLRPVLRPGLRVFRRDDAHLQVGIDRPRVVLADTPGVRRLLTDLQTGAGLDAALTPEAGMALERLLASGLVVEQRELTTRPSAALSVFARHGPEAPDRLAARAACRVEVVAPERWRSPLLRWLADTGVGAAPAAAEGAPRSVTLLVTVDEPRRSVVDALVAEDRPHLLLSLGADRARLGPFVVPGVTACLRCVDAALTERDPRRPLVLEQLEDALAVDGPHDPVLSHAAGALAVRELTTYAEGDRPATWSATIEVGADLDLPHRTWSRHPHCGCSWG